VADFGIAKGFADLTLECVAVAKGVSQWGGRCGQSAPTRRQALKSAIPAHARLGKATRMGAREISWARDRASKSAMRFWLGRSDIKAYGCVRPISASLWQPNPANQRCEPRIAA
jgi:hypothetical protein